MLDFQKKNSKRGTILISQRINEHWIPFYMKCAFCNVDCNRFIGRLETFEQVKTNLTKEIPLQDAGERILNTATSKVINDEKLNEDAENMQTIFKTSVIWTQNKIIRHSGPNVVKLLVLGYPR